MAQSRGTRMMLTRRSARRGLTGATRVGQLTMASMVMSRGKCRAAAAQRFSVAILRGRQLALLLEVGALQPPNNLHNNPRHYIQHGQLCEHYGQPGDLPVHGRPCAQRGWHSVCASGMLCRKEPNPGGHREYLQAWYERSLSRTWFAFCLVLFFFFYTARCICPNLFLAVAP